MSQLVLPTAPMLPQLRRRLAGELLQAAQDAFGSGLTAATVKGSALKGGFIPYYSDFDLHVFVAASDVAMRDARTPAVEPGLRLQAALGHLDPADFQVSGIQLYVVDQDNYPADWTPPLPATYAVIYGRLPDTLPAVTPAALREDARSFFPWVPDQITKLVGRILDKPDRSLAGTVRLLGTGVKPAVYHAAILQGGEPLAVWREPLHRLLPQVEAEACPSGALSAFFGYAVTWREVTGDPAALREMFRLGCRALEELVAWAAGLDAADAP